MAGRVRTGTMSPMGILHQLGLAVLFVVLTITAIVVGILLLAGLATVLFLAMVFGLFALASSMCHESFRPKEKTSDPVS